MARLELFNKVTRGLYRTKYKVQKCSPEIWMGAGIFGAVVAGVLACRATLSLEDTIDEAKDRIDEVKDNADEYTEKEYNQKLTAAYAKGAMDVVCLYGPSMALGAISLGAIVNGHHILKKRNFALTTAYAALDKKYKDYRGRVIERFGNEVDDELRFNTRVEEIEEKTTDENGNEVTVKKNVTVIDKTTFGPHQFYFDETCKGYTNDPETNLMIVRNYQELANHLLRIRSIIVVNDIRDIFGLPRTKAGALDGWIYDPNIPNDEPQIDFGVINSYGEFNRRFVNGLETMALIDLNCEANVDLKI